MPGWALAVICAVGPLLWAISVAAFFRGRDQRKTRFNPPEQPPSDYSI